MLNAFVLSIFLVDSFNSFENFGSVLIVDLYLFDCLRNFNNIYKLVFCIFCVQIFYSFNYLSLIQRVPEGTCNTSGECSLS